MDFINNLNETGNFLILLGSVFGGGVAAFFIIRTQMVKVLKEELRVYKDKVERMEKDIKLLTEQIHAVSNENLSLISERDYLKSLIVSALTTKGTVHEKILKEAIKEIDSKKIYQE